jgi:rod shape-determining protein MreD
MTNIKLLFIGFILLYISSMFADTITIYNLTPNIILPWVIYTSIRLEYKIAITFTFIISLGHDILNPQLLGFTTILFVLLSYFISKYNANFNKKFLSTIFWLFIANMMFYITQYLYFSIRFPEPLFLLQKTGLTIVYSSIMSCFILYIIYFFEKLRFKF